MVPVGIILGLTAALTIGLSDFFVALVSRQLGTLRTLLGVQIVGTVALLLYFVGVGRTTNAQSEPLIMSLLIGAGLGILAAFSYLSLYKGLLLGPIAIVSPITSSYGAVTVLLALFIFNEPLSFWQGLGICLTLVGVILATTDASIIRKCLIWRAPSATTQHELSSAEEYRGFNLSKWRTAIQRKNGVVFGFAAMLGFGFQLFFLARWTQVIGPIESVLLIRLFSAITLLLYSFYRREWKWKSIPLRTLGGIILIGLFDTAGLVAYSIGTTKELTSVVATISSSYSLIPIILGIVVFRERLARVPGLGICSIIMGLIILATGGR